MKKWTKFIKGKILDTVLAFLDCLYNMKMIEERNKKKQKKSCLIVVI